MKSFAFYEKLPEKGVETYREGEDFSICFDFQKVEKPSDDTMHEMDYENYYQFQRIFMRGAVNYASVVSAIMNDAYSTDSVQAIIANYTEARDAEEPTEKELEYIKEYNEYQAFRKHAKEIANIICN